MDDQDHLLKQIFGAPIWRMMKHAVYRGFQGRPDPTTGSDIEFKKREKHRRQLGSAHGNYYLYYIDEIKIMKRQGRYDEAVELLLVCVEAVEREAEFMEEGVSPWYYEQLAIIYRKQKRYTDEVAILERYASTDKAAGRGPDRMADRLIKAKALRTKSQNQVGRVPPHSGG